MKFGNRKLEKAFTFIMSVGGFLLFLEWFYYPIKLTTNISHIYIFMLYGMFCFLLTVSRVKWWFSWFIKGLGIVIIIHILFFKNMLLLSREWREIVYEE